MTSHLVCLIKVLMNEYGDIFRFYFWTLSFNQMSKNSFSNVLHVKCIEFRFLITQNFYVCTPIRHVGGGVVVLYLIKVVVYFSKDVMDGLFREGVESFDDS